MCLFQVSRGRHGAVPPRFQRGQGDVGGNQVGEGDNRGSRVDIMNRPKSHESADEPSDGKCKINSEISVFIFQEQSGET